MSDIEAIQFKLTDQFLAIHQILTASKCYNINSHFNLNEELRVKNEGFASAKFANR